METIPIDPSKAWTADRDCTIKVKQGAVFLKTIKGYEPLHGFGRDKELQLSMGDQLVSYTPDTTIIRSKAVD
jgi:hypothetical protein